MGRTRVSVVAAGLFVWAAAQSAPSHVRAVRLKLAAVGIEVLAPGATGWQEAANGDPLVETMQLRNAREFSEIQLECGSALRLGSGAQLALPRLDRAADGQTRTTVHLDGGSLTLRLESSDTAGFRLELPGAAVSPHGKNLALEVALAGAPAITVQEGEALVDWANTQYAVKKDQSLLLQPGGAKFASPAAPDSLALWSAGRDRSGPHTPPPAGLADLASSNPPPLARPVSLNTGGNNSAAGAPAAGGAGNGINNSGGSSYPMGSGGGHGPGSGLGSIFAIPAPSDGVPDGGDSSVPNLRFTPSLFGGHGHGGQVAPPLPRLDVCGA